MKNAFYKTTLPFLLIIALLTGCSKLFIEQSSTSDLEEKGQTEQEGFQSNKTYNNPTTQENPAKDFSSVEVLWSVPDSTVDSYTIRYGFSRDALNQSVTVAENALEKMEDPGYGFVYRFVIEEMPADQSIFVSLTAHTGSETSPPSAVFEIPPKGY